MAQFRYLESKASRNGLPSIANLTDNQAVFLDALRNGQVESITTSNGVVNGLAGPQGIDIVDFQLYATQLFD